jgi:amino acid adenylation domain-containing protein
MMEIAIDAVPARVARMADAAPGAVALRAPGSTLDYAGLIARADALAGALAAAGAGRGALIAVCLDRGFDQIVALLATWRTGAAFLPLDPAWPDLRLRAILDDAGCDLVVADASGAARLAESGMAVVAPDAAEPFPAAASSASGDLAYVVYTSGSTGAPKGVEITHANLAALVDWHLAAFAVTADDRATHLAGLGFDAAIWEVWPYLCAGASVTPIDGAARTSGTILRDRLIAERITIAFAPTALADELTLLDWPADAALRLLLTGADRLHAHPRAGLPFPLVNNYGPTECTVVATSGIVAPGGSGMPTIGRAIAGTIVEITDEDGTPVAAGTIGEIRIGGAGVARGYRGRPDLTADRFVVRDGRRFYRSGDRGALLPTGEIAYHGRIDDHAKVRGHRVEPGEVAAMLRTHPAVRAAAAAVRTDTLVGYVVPAAETPGAEALGTWLAERLPDYMVPGAFVRLDALPLGPNGKLDPAALPAPSDANRLPAAGFATPETPAQTRLCAILGEVLGHGPVGIDDNFFLLGGHSLLGTQMVLRAGAAFGVEVTLRHLFLAPTIRQLAALIEGLVLEAIEQMSETEAARRVAR